MSKSKSVPINTKYLRDVIHESGLSNVKFAEGIGRSDSVVYNAISKKEMQIVVAKMICSVYGADYEKLTTSEGEEKTPDQKTCKPDGAVMDKQDAEKAWQLLYLLLVEVEAMHREQKEFQEKLMEVLK